MFVRSVTGVVISLVLAAAPTAPARAGDLNPPAGPVAPTMKPLAEVEPRIAINDVNTPGNATGLYVISQPGSYYLTGNIVGVSGKHGIIIGASGVTLDLMGFDLRGVSGSLDGLSTPGLVHGLSVRNGAIRQWGGTGVNLVFASGAVVADIRVSHNGANGLTLGPRTTATACTAISNSGHGILAFDWSVVERCTATGNTLDGIRAATGCLVRASTASLNGGSGINASSYTIVDGCSCNNNFTDGIRSGAQTRVVNNVCCVNSGAGIRTMLTSNYIEGNMVQGNQYGIRTEPGTSTSNYIVRNTASSNSTSNYSFSGLQVPGPVILQAGVINSSNPYVNWEY